MADVAIYGSGFAGYTLAAAALEQGQRVIVVERGPRADRHRSADTCSGPFAMGADPIGRTRRANSGLTIARLVYSAWAAPLSFGPGNGAVLMRSIFAGVSASRAWPITVRRS